MEQCRRQFFWGEVGEDEAIKKKMHLIKWSRICEDKVAGGLGLKKIEEKNLAQLAIWWLKLRNFRNYKWISFIINKYGKNIIFEECRRRNNMSSMFNNLWNVKSSSKLKQWVDADKLNWRVGNDNEILCWKDIWWDNKPLNMVFRRLFDL